MKFRPALAAAFVVLMSLNACQERVNPNAPQVPSGAMLVQDEGATKRGSARINTEQMAAVQRFQSGSLAGQKFDLKKIETLKARMPQRNAEDAANRQQVLTLMNTMLMAENKQRLNVQFSMSDAPIETGVFVFTIESPDKQELNFQMYDEEGFALAANNRIKVEQGANYRALNVEQLENGQYVFHLRNQDGQELFRKVIIEHR